jgi:hypothetical protein
VNKVPEEWLKVPSDRKRCLEALEKVLDRTLRGSGTNEKRPQEAPETVCFEWIQWKFRRILPQKAGTNALYQLLIRTKAHTVVPEFDPLQTAKTAEYRPV